MLFRHSIDHSRAIGGPTATDDSVCAALLRRLATLPSHESPAGEDLELLAHRLHGSFLEHGLIAAPGDPTATAWAARAAAMMRLVLVEPFCSRRRQARICGGDARAFGRLETVVRSDPLFEGFLARHAASAPYHESTIGPIVATGAVEAYEAGEYRYPFTVGIYPAVSCMLSCGFCGRARGVRYDRADLPLGNALLRELITEAPTDRPQRFYLSGGLEPLTNPGLGELVHAARGRGLAMQLYTNGMMLTPRFLAAHEGLWDLGTVRISLYGADDATAERVTGRAGVATRVLDNAKDFVRLVVERGAEVRLAFNHVVEKGRVDHLAAIARAVRDVAALDPDRKAVSFLSLREDYTASGEVAIQGAERERLREELLALIELLAAEGLENLRVDLGYAMRGLVEGRPTLPVHRVSHADMLARGYPQISVVVDLLGDVYLYREAGFLGRVGADRYIVGRLGRDGSFEAILRRFVEDGQRRIEPRPGDELFLDAFDHAVTAYLRQKREDEEFGRDGSAELTGRLH